MIILHNNLIIIYHIKNRKLIKVKVKHFTKVFYSTKLFKLLYIMNHIPIYVCITIIIIVYLPLYHILIYVLISNLILIIFNNTNNKNNEF